MNDILNDDKESQEPYDFDLGVFKPILTTVEALIPSATEMFKTYFANKKKG